MKSGIPIVTTDYTQFKSVVPAGAVSPAGEYYDMSKYVKSQANSSYSAFEYSTSWINNYFKVSKERTKKNRYDNLYLITNDNAKEIGIDLDIRRIWGYSRYLFKQLNAFLTDVKSEFWSEALIKTIIDLCNKMNTMSLDNYKAALNFDVLAKYVKISPEVTTILKVDASKLDSSKQYYNTYSVVYQCLGNLLAKISNISLDLTDYSYLQKYKRAVELSKIHEDDVAVLMYKLLVFYTIVYAIPYDMNLLVKAICSNEKNEFDAALKKAKEEYDAMDPISRMYADDARTGRYSGD